MSAQLTPSMNISAQKPALTPACEMQYQRYRASNAQYGAGDIISIDIPTGGARNSFLHPGESFLELKFKPTFTLTGGALSLDNCAYSLFSSARIYHGSNELCNINNCGRLWNALFDYASGASRMARSIDMGCDHAIERDGRSLTSNSVYTFCIPLILPLLGSLSDHVLPIGWMEAGNLRLELTLNPFANMVTTSNGSSLEAADGACTANPVLTSVLIYDVFYNAKVSRLSSDLNQALIESFGDRPISIPAVDYRTEMVSVPSGASSITTKLNFQHRSLKSVMWYAVTQSIALGSFTAFNLGRSQSSRFAGGRLRDFAVEIDGAEVPSGRVQCGAAGLTLPASVLESDFHSAIPFAQLLRCFNQMNSSFVPVSFPRQAYGCSLTTVAGQLDNSPSAFLTGIDLERAGSDAETAVFAGTNTKNSNVNLQITYESASAAAQTLFVFGHHDVVYNLVQGSLVRSD